MQPKTRATKKHFNYTIHFSFYKLPEIFNGYLLTFLLASFFILSLKLILLKLDFENKMSFSAILKIRNCDEILHLLIDILTDMIKPYFEHAWSRSRYEILLVATFDSSCVICRSHKHKQWLQAVKDNGQTCVYSAYNYVREMFVSHIYDVCLIQYRDNMYTKWLWMTFLLNVELKIRSFFR